MYLITYQEIHIINAVTPDPKPFFKAASVPNVAAGNLNGIKTLLANDVSAFFINGQPSVV